MTFQHQQLAEGRWFEMPFMEKLANVGSEVERTISWRKKGNGEYSALAFDRALELIDLTLQDPRNRMYPRLKEVARVREALADYFVGENQYGSKDELWQKYFYAFSLAAQMARHGRVIKAKI